MNTWQARKTLLSGACKQQHCDIHRELAEKTFSENRLVQALFTKNVTSILFESEEGIAEMNESITNKCLTVLERYHGAGTAIFVNTVNH